MARFRLLIEYEGTRYHGWQQNSGVKTIQGEILSACEKLFNTIRIELYGAGRTDAGVHALGQVAHMEVPTQMHPPDIVERLNESLPYDIHILSAETCEANFHARHSAVARSYIYAISKRRSAFGKRYAWWVKESLNLNKMKDVASVLKGFHDFSSFGAASPDEKSTKVNIQHLEVSGDGNMILVHLIGSHFLWMMVRRITGVLVYAGRDKISLKEVQSFLKIHSERPSQLAAPASGLYLEKIYYPGESFQYNPQVPIFIK